MAEKFKISLIHPKWINNKEFVVKYVELLLCFKKTPFYTSELNHGFYN